MPHSQFTDRSHLTLTNSHQLSPTLTRDKAKAEREAAKGNAPAVAAVAAAPVVVAAKVDYSECKLQLRMPTGTPFFFPFFSSFFLLLVHTFFHVLHELGILLSAPAGSLGTRIILLLLPLARDTVRILQHVAVLITMHPHDPFIQAQQ